METKSGNLTINSINDFDLEDIDQSDGDTISRAPNDHGKLIGHTKEGYAIRIM